MIVEECMSKNPHACSPGDPLSSSARTMWEHDLGALPVVDTSGAVIGMITDRDLCMAAYTCGLPLHASSVGRHMSRTVFSIGPKADATKAAELMKSHQLRRLPVVDGGKLVGMLSLADLARTAGRNGKQRGLDREHVAEVLASVCRPRAKTVAAALMTKPAAGANTSSASTAKSSNHKASSAQPAAPLPKKRRLKSILHPKPRAFSKRK